MSQHLEPHYRKKSLQFAFLDAWLAATARRLAPITRAALFLRRLLPLSGRGLVIVALSAGCLWYYALPMSDLSASIICSFLLALSVLLFLRGIIAARSLRRGLSAELLFDAQGLFSQRDIASGMIVESSALPAFYRLELSRRFVQNGVRSPSHRIRGIPASGNKLRLLDTCHFPHRGCWELTGINVRLSDLLGLTSFQWVLPHHQIVEIYPPRSSVRPLPIVAASSQPGDLLQDTENRTGDLFDIKAYDPSDGTKRILWKTYAKSRQLVVRRPEPAMVPEGEVAVFSLARRTDEHVASAALAYVDQLERNNIVVLFGCDALPSTQAPAYANTFVAGPQAAEVSCLEIWKPGLGMAVQLRAFIESLRSQNKFPFQIIYFIDKERLHETGATSMTSVVTDICQQYQVQPVFVAVDPLFLNPQHVRTIAKRKVGAPHLRLAQQTKIGIGSSMVVEAQRAEA